MHFDVQIVPFPIEIEEKEWIIANAVRSLLEQDLTVDDLIVLVTDITESDGIPAFCERLLIEFPELTIMGICRGKLSHSLLSIANSRAGTEQQPVGTERRHSGMHQSSVAVVRALAAERFI